MASKATNKQATALGISKGAVTKYVGLASNAALDWPTIEAMSQTD